MKVVCIGKDTPEHDHQALRKAADDIQIGSEYTVIEVIEWTDGITYYDLLEFPHEHRIWWRSEYFAEVSDLDETALVNEEWEEKVCVPVNHKS